MNSSLVLRKARLRVVFGWIDQRSELQFKGWLSHLPREAPSLDRGSRLEHGGGRPNRQARAGGGSG